MTQHRQTESEQKHSSGKRGFANMDEEKQREAASKGGKAAQNKRTPHESTRDEKEGGKKGASK